MTLSRGELAALRFSLVFVWLATALVSVWELHGQSQGLLAAAGISEPAVVQGLVWAGAAADLLLAVAMCWKPGPAVYRTALVLMVVMTLLASLLDASLWLHPLGPLTKNLPIAAVLWVLAKERR
jgi:hypothetical protein